MPNIPTNVTMTIAAARGIRLVKARTSGAAITAAVAAAPRSAKTCAARSTTITKINVVAVKKARKARPRADTTTA